MKKKHFYWLIFSVRYLNMWGRLRSWGFHQPSRWLLCIYVTSESWLCIEIQSEINGPGGSFVVYSITINIFMVPTTMMTSLDSLSSIPKLSAGNRPMSSYEGSRHIYHVRTWSHLSLCWNILLLSLGWSNKLWRQLWFYFPCVNWVQQQMTLEGVDFMTKEIVCQHSHFFDWLKRYLCLFPFTANEK